MLVENLLESIQQNITGFAEPAATADFQGTQLLHDEDTIPAPTPVKTEQDGGLGVF
jgi:hypothetical protein